MALAKRGSRIIRVDGWEYRWAVSPGDYDMKVVVERRNGPGQRLVMHVEYGDVRTEGVGGGWLLIQRNLITPALVRRGILDALSGGWVPAAPGKELHTCVAGSDLLGNTYHWL